MVMKLYDYTGAPNPRRVKIFINEKGLDVELIQCDMSKGEHKTESFLAKNPSGKLPVLETEDGRYIAESIAICRYLEAIQPEPNLFGRDAYELGHIEARNRQIELELWYQIGTSWVNGPIVGRLGIIKQIPDAKAASDRNVRRYYKRLNDEFGQQEYVAGDRFSIADITLLCSVDFASAMVELKPEDTLTHLWRWHSLVSARQSVAGT
jgi:glutathione S-transferase